MLYNYLVFITPLSEAWYGRLGSGDIAHIVEYLQHHTNVLEISIVGMYFYRINFNLLLANLTTILGYPLSNSDLIELSGVIQLNTTLQYLQILSIFNSHWHIGLIIGLDCGLRDDGAITLAKALKKCSQLQRVELFSFTNSKDTVLQYYHEAREVSVASMYRVRNGNILIIVRQPDCR